MTKKNKSQLEILVEKLDRELIARSGRKPIDEQFRFAGEQGTPEQQTIMKRTEQLYRELPPLNPALRHIDTEKLVKLLLRKIRELNKERGTWGKDERKDYFEIEDERVRKNARCVAALCFEKSLLPQKGNLAELKVKNYRKAFNLSANEPFQRQPIAAGRLCTGFLVEEDIIATAGHFADESNVTDLRIIFDYRMEAPDAPVIRTAENNIYKGVKIISRVKRSLSDGGSDWALVKLDREVEGQTTVMLSAGPAVPGQSIYVLGHPCGLPLKYAPGASVHYIENAYFGADLDIYSGNSGSPVFDSVTHEVIGMVVRGDNMDFRWTGRNWVSVRYPNPCIPSKKPQCTRVSEFTPRCGEPIRG